MIRLDSRLRITFWAVPAFMRVEPAITSSPVSVRIGCEQMSRIGAPALFEMPMVWAPRAAASFRAAMVNGVRPLAAAPMTTSFGPMFGALDSGDAFLDRVFGVLDRLHDRAFAAGDQVDQLVVGPVERRRQFRAVLHADAPRGARAHIDEPPAAFAAALPPPRPRSQWPEARSERRRRRRAGLRRMRKECRGWARNRGPDSDC